ncbi:MAG: hypothetical protein R2729_10955 [Bryobacteraceae bacterium]
MRSTAAATGARLALLFAAAVAASAQVPPLTCAVSGTAVPVRSSGRSELAASVLITCTGGSPTPDAESMPQTDVIVSVPQPATITSRILDPSNFNEALLLIDDPANDEQYVCEDPLQFCSGTGNGLGFGYYGPGTFENRNVLQGRQTSPGQLIFRGLNFDPPGSGSRTLRIVNIRLDVSALSTGANVVLDLSTQSGGYDVPINLPLSPRTVTVATVQDAISTTVRDTSGSLAPAGGVVVQTGTAGTEVHVADLRVTELFPDAVMRRDDSIPETPGNPFSPADQSDPTFDYQTETGFYNQAFPAISGRGDLATAGLADWGTRVRVTFRGVPAGVRLFVSDLSLNGGAWALTAADATGAGAFSWQTNATHRIEIPVVNGVGTAVWEQLGDDPAMIEFQNLGVYLTYPAGAVTSGPITADVSLAPVSTDPTLIPRHDGRSTTHNVVVLQTGTPPPPPPPALTCSAQTPTANAIRAEGRTELVASLVVTCTGGAPTLAGQSIPTANFRITSPVPITSANLSGTRSEALVLIDDPGPAMQFPCTGTNGQCPAFGNGTGTGYYGGGSQTPTLPNNRNVFQGDHSTTNAIDWAAIPVDPPGANQLRTFRFENIRIDASQLSAPPSGQVNVQLTIATVSGVAISNGIQVVSIARSGLSTSVRNAANSAALPNAGASIDTTAAATRQRIATLRFSELFAAAFKRRTLAVPPNVDASPAPVNQNTPGAVPLTESGFVNLSFPNVVGLGNLATAGLANSGARIRAVFSAIPAGMTLSVGTTSDTGKIRLISTVSGGAGAFTPVPPTTGTIADLTASNGSVTTVWEALLTDSGAIEDIDIPVYATYPAGFNAASPIQVNLSLAPEQQSLWLPHFFPQTSLTNVAAFASSPPPPPAMVTCAAQPPAADLIRAEGRTELVASLTVVCTGGAPFGAGLSLDSTDIRITAPVPITSRILNPTLQRSEALALVDEPAPGSQFLCADVSGCSGFGNGTGTGYYGGNAQSPNSPNNRNVFQGIQTSPNVLSWPAIPFDPPGSSALRTLRFENIRIDASQLNVSPGGQVTVPIVIDSVEGIQIANGTQIVAIARHGLSGSVRDAANTAAAPANGVTVNTTSAGARQRIATLRFSELFASSLRRRNIALPPNIDTSPPPVSQNIPGIATHTESGFVVLGFPTLPGLGDMWRAGLADSGARIRAVFSGVPPGVDLSVGTTSESGRIRLIGVGSSGSGAFNPVSPVSGSIADLTVGDGAAAAIWEVLLTDPSAVETLDIPVYATYPQSFTASTPIRVSFSLVAQPDPAWYPNFGPQTGAGNLAVFSPGQTPVTPPPPPIQESPSLLVDPVTITLRLPSGGSATQTLRIRSTVLPLNWGIGSQTPFPVGFNRTRGVTPDQVDVTISTGGLGPGSYSGFLAVTAPDATNSTVLVHVNLEVFGALRLISISPESSAPNPTGIVLTARGENVPAGTVVQWNGAPLPTTGAGTTLTAQIAGSLLVPGTALITLRAPDGTVSNSLPFEVTDRPVITSLSPNPVTAGRSAFDLSIEGRGFIRSSSATLDGVALGPRSITATQIVAFVSASQVARPGSFPVKVSNGQVMSNEVPLVVNPAPVITRLDPAEYADPTQTLALAVIGTNFPSDATVRVDGTPVNSVWISDSRFDATVPAGMLAGRDRGLITVLTSDGVSSNQYPLPVGGAIMVMSAPIAAGDRGATIMLMGSGFVPGTRVQFERPGSAPVIVTPDVLTENKITVTIPPDFSSRPGAITVRVLVPGMAPSQAVTVTVEEGPVITSLTPDSAPLASGAVDLKISGSGFLPGSSVLWNGQPIGGSGTLTMLQTTVPASLIAAAGTAGVVVVTPGGARSNLASFRLILPPPPSFSSTSPATSTSNRTVQFNIETSAGYPAPLTGKFTLTFEPDGGLPDDPAIAFADGTRMLNIALPANSTTPVPVNLRTGTTAGTIVLTAMFDPPEGGTAPELAPLRIAIARAIPVFDVSITCSRTSATELTITADGYSNTREVRQAAFTFAPAPGESFASQTAPVDVNGLFSTWYASSASSQLGGTFRYRQIFNVQPAASAVASVTLTLTNAVGSATSAPAACQ